MSTVIVTGSAGLIGSEAVRYFASRGYQVVGIDNDMRSRFFGEEASTKPTRMRLEADVPGYKHRAVDIRDKTQIDWIFETHPGISAVIHTAAQPSHDWAARDPVTDFEVNANGTLNLLEATRRHCPNAAFVFTSTNKVYGDRPNRVFFGYREAGIRLEPDGFDYECEQWAHNTHGFDETTPVDHCTHSLFGCSKLAADILVQEYGRYLGMNTVCFRGGCLTGPAHAGTRLHGFLSYLVKCAAEGIPYQIIGYDGKQVRDNIHSADLVAAFDRFIEKPRHGCVYNIGGGRRNSCSVLEAIDLVERIGGRKIEVSFVDEPRVGDHKWWISDTRKFEADYPGWQVTIGLEQIVTEMVEAYSQGVAA